MNAVTALKNKFGQRLKLFEKSRRRVYLTVAKSEAAEVVKYLFCELGARFSIASGVDRRAVVEILYHLAIDAEGVLVTVRVPVEKPALEMPSFVAFLPAVDWIEREIHEMFGVKFLGHPNLKTLLLPDDWPAEVYPLRKKSFDSENEVVTGPNYG